MNIKKPTQSGQADTNGPSTASIVSPSKRPKNNYDYSTQRPLRSPQARLALKALREHPHGITTTSLQREPYNICHPPARIMDLRKAGYRIETLQNENSVGRYVLLTGSEAHA